MSNDKPVKIEPVGRQQIQMLERTLGIGAMVCRLGDVDTSLGCGVFDKDKNGTLSKCLWTKDRCRITIALASDGGIISSVGKEPDPHCPKESLKGESR